MKHQKREHTGLIFLILEMNIIIITIIIYVGLSWMIETKEQYKFAVVEHYI